MPTEGTQIALSSAPERLDQPVSTVMSETFITLPLDEPLRIAAKAMRDRRVGLVLVTDGDDLVGVLTERDIATCIADDDDVDTVTLADRARGNIVTITSTEPIQQAVDLMAARGIRHLVVVDGVLAQPTGVISARDVLAELSRQ